MRFINRFSPAPTASERLTAAVQFTAKAERISSAENRKEILTDGVAEIFFHMQTKSDWDKYDSALRSFGSFTQRERRRGLALGKSG